MKKILLGIIAIGAFHVSHAQKLVLAVHGGVGANSIPQNKDSAVLPSGASTMYNYAVSVNAFTNVRRWQFGLGIDMQPISRKSSTTTYYFANPASPIYLFANRMLTEHFYAGASFGLMVANSADNSKYDKNSLVPVEVNYAPGTGYTGGLRVGYNITLGEKFDACIQLDGRYGSTKYSYTYTTKAGGNPISASNRYSYYYYGITIGLRLKMFTDPFRQW